MNIPSDSGSFIMPERDELVILEEPKNKLNRKLPPINIEQGLAVLDNRRIMIQDEPK